MLQNHGPVVQALMGTMFTWALTAAGAGLVVVFKGTQRKLLDTSLGFAGGVMTAASYWSLLAPAIEMAKESKLYGQNGEYAFAPVAVGFLLGALFVYGTDFFISALGVNSLHMALAFSSSSSSSHKEKKTDRNSIFYNSNRNQRKDTTTIEGFGENAGNSNLMSRRRITGNSIHRDHYHPLDEVQETGNSHNTKQWKRILLLIVAITVHNIPEGLAVGVGFGAIGNSPTATFENARYLQKEVPPEPA